MITINAFTRAYIEAALWSTNDESTPQGGEPLDKNFGMKDIAPDTLQQIVADCKRFQEENGLLIKDENCLYKRCAVEEYAGHDFWLTRNHHGCGFWDGDWQQEVGLAHERPPHQPCTRK